MVEDVVASVLLNTKYQRGDYGLLLTQTHTPSYGLLFDTDAHLLQHLCNVVEMVMHLAVYTSLCAYLMRE